jgi:hypothetical protein
MAYQSGEHYVLCDICSFQYYRSECTKTWDNLIACPECFDGPRPIQDYRVKPRFDKQAVRDARPRITNWIRKSINTEGGEQIVTEAGYYLTEEYTE